VDKAIDYPSATAGELAAALAARQVSAVELFEAAVATIEARDGPINAIVVRDFDRAHEAAKAADAALARGERAPLLGVPMTVKEAFRMAGLPATWGIAEYKGWTPTADAVVVQRLKAAGAVILGKSNIQPFLGDWQSNNPIYGRTCNPYDLTRVPGGSSGGSAAALAAGMVPLELGSDIGGSVRVPAHMCGVFGHKASFGLVPGRDFAAPPFDAEAQDVEFGVYGPLARTAADLELGLRVVAGPSEDDWVGYRLALPPPRHKALKDFRVLVITEHPLVDGAVRGPIETLADELAALGAKVARQSPLAPDILADHRRYQAMLGAINRRSVPGATTTLTSFDWMNGLDDIVAARAKWRALFAAFDVVLAPPFGVPAYPHQDETDWSKRTFEINGAATPYGAQLSWPGIAGYPGLPSTCAPLGLTAGGLPTGVQIIGPRFEDFTTIAFAALIERDLGKTAPTPPGLK
jgi:amidase